MGSIAEAPQEKQEVWPKHVEVYVEGQGHQVYWPVEMDRIVHLYSAAKVLLKAIKDSGAGMFAQESEILTRAIAKFEGGAE